MPERAQTTEGLAKDTDFSRAGTRFKRDACVMRPGGLETQNF